MIDVRDTVSPPDPPTGMLMLDGDSEMEKSGLTGRTVSERPAVLVMVPDLTAALPKIIMVKFPATAVELTVTLRVVLAEAPVRDMSVWFRLAVTPVGTPDNESVSVPVRPLRE